MWDSTHACNIRCDEVSKIFFLTEVIKELSPIFLDLVGIRRLKSTIRVGKLCPGSPETKGANGKSENADSSVYLT